MAVNEIVFKQITEELDAKHVTLVAVSKTKPVTDIQQLYDLGQRDFGENYVQEIIEKQAVLPPDIHWHFIGHLQSNKVKYLVPFVYMIHGVDSLKLLKEIDRQALKNNRTISVLLQVHIAMEETKFGLDEEELNELISTLPGLPNIALKGLMGMASFTDDDDIVRNEFRRLKALYEKINVLYAAQFPGSQLTTLSMGMSADYRIAIEEGSNMIRIGSLLFGVRN
ncbi:MAG: YggS family pyridoxal phosphate-dependent enzyme [Sphingobacteriales bacterium]|nr:YggS family pyridoxal phosphate-dependent enzyme [Sphingobacteriales bacterium]OJY90273.1 MAG: YggS family pyridoxal phosphate enzyme [Sphingobacteriales bacterium 44-15]